MRTVWNWLAIAAASMVLAVTACTGGEGNGPVGSSSQLDYSNAAEGHHSYTPYTSGSHIYHWAWGDVRETYIGGDVEPKENLRHMLTQDGIEYYIGASRDGAGVDRLENYEHDLITEDGTIRVPPSTSGFKPFRIQPTVIFDPELTAPENTGIARALLDSIFILNDFLPPEFQLTIGGLRNVNVAYSGEILINLESPANIALKCGPGAVACATYPSYGIYTNQAAVYIPDDFDVSEHTLPRKVIIHELLHALGIRGHVDSIEFPDSIMGASGEYIPNVGHIISKIDREILQIMYMSQRTDLYNDWGEWSDVSHHLAGRSEDDALHFGVALFNGLPQPWVRGATPSDNLIDNKTLYGTATWTGKLLGYSGPSPIAGDAELEVRLSTLRDPNNEQNLRFTDIFFVNRFENSDLSNASDRWFDTRNISYKINVFGNTFRNVWKEGYEDGHVAGAFLGSEHEHMGGTVKRTDMVGAFGGSR